jgi:hypothetical protein
MYHLITILSAIRDTEQSIILSHPLQWDYLIILGMHTPPVFSKSDNLGQRRREACFSAETFCTHSEDGGERPHKHVMRSGRCEKQH